MVYPLYAVLISKWQCFLRHDIVMYQIWQQCEWLGYKDVWNSNIMPISTFLLRHHPRWCSLIEIFNMSSIFLPHSPLPSPSSSFFFSFPPLLSPPLPFLPSPPLSASSLHRLGLYRDAEAQFKSALKQFATIDAYLFLCKVYVKLDQPMTALDYYEKVTLEWDDINILLWYQHARNWLKLE